MRGRIICRNLRCLTLFMIIALPLGLYAQTSQLGKVEFQTSGSPTAQSHFLRGLAALHSFWYDEAMEAFRESTKTDPEFMMGYWGEAMAHNHTLWSEQDTAAARSVIGKIKETPKLSARERAYLNAVKLLYGEGDKRTRDSAYSRAMEKIYTDYGDDLDAAAFYSLSLWELSGRRIKATACRRAPGQSHSTSIGRILTIPAPHTTSFTPSTIPIMRSLLYRRRVVMPTSRPRRIMRVTCLPISFCNWECGRKPRPQMNRRGKSQRHG